MKTECHISERLQASCDVCGEWPDRLHMPEDFHGWYCARCCPACKAQAIADTAGSQPDAGNQAA